MEIKGLPRSVEAWQVRREATYVSRFEALHEGPLPPLVGRQEEIELLLRRWDQAKLGETPDAQKLELAKKAGQAEREAAVATAELAVASAQRKSATADAMPATDAKARDTANAAAKKLLTDAKAALEKAEAARKAPKSPESYTPMSVAYPAQSTGRRSALAEWLTRRSNQIGRAHV